VSLDNALERALSGPPPASELCLCSIAEGLPIATAQARQEQEQRNQVVLRMREHFQALAGGATDGEQQALNTLAVHLMGSGEADLAALNQWCAGFQNNPQALLSIFNKFHDLLLRFGISSRVVHVPEVEQVDREHVYMDIMVPGTNHALRLSSNPTESGIVMTTGNIINADGQLQEIQYVIPGNNPVGTMRAIQNALVRALYQRR